MSLVRGPCRCSQVLIWAAITGQLRLCKCCNHELHHGHLNEAPAPVKGIACRWCLRWQMRVSPSAARRCLCWRPGAHRRCAAARRTRSSAPDQAAPPRPRWCCSGSASPGWGRYRQADHPAGCPGQHPGLHGHITLLSLNPGYALQVHPRTHLRMGSSMVSKPLSSLTEVPPCRQSSGNGELTLCQKPSKMLVRFSAVGVEAGASPQRQSVITWALRCYARPVQVRRRCCGAALGPDGDRRLIRPPCSATCITN